MIYFDHNATSPLLPEVVETMRQCMTATYANPSSAHKVGRQARGIVDRARETLAAFVNVHPSQIIFTSGGTESNNLAIKGCIEGMGLRQLAISAIEHPSVTNVAKYLGRNCQLTELGVDVNGKLEMAQFADYCNTASSPALVSVMLANNESGVLQDVGDIAQICCAKGHILHTDAVQAAGKIQLDFKSLGVNLMSLSAHKLNGPKGIGALVFDKILSMEPLLHGGGQERGIRSGTENVVAIAGFAAAVEISQSMLEEKNKKLTALREYFELRLKQIPGVVIHSEAVKRLPNTSYFSFPGIDGETLLMQLDVNNIAVASGSACASKSARPSHVLLAMGVEDLQARSAIRVSLGLENTRQEIDHLMNVLGQQYRMLNDLEAIV